VTSRRKTYLISEETGERGGQRGSSLESLHCLTSPRDVERGGVGKTRIHFLNLNVTEKKVAREVVFQTSFHS